MAVEMTSPAGDTTFGNVNVPAQYQGYVLTSAARWGISPAVLSAQIQAESSFNPHAVSSAGAVGIAQFLPSTAKENGIDPYNVEQAIDGMAMLDARYLKEFGSMDQALAAYNAGPGAVQKYGGVPPYAETENYVKKIMSTAGQAFDAVATNPASVIEPLIHAKQLAEHLLDPNFWKRVGIGVLAVLLLVVGVFFIVQKSASDFAVSHADTIAKVAEK